MIYVVNNGHTDVRSILRKGVRHHAVQVHGRHFGDLYVKIGHPHSPPWVSFFAGAVSDLTDHVVTSFLLS